MPEPLSVAVAQPACEAYDVAANADEHAAAVREARARVVVFPELSLTGYELDAPTVRVDDPRLDPIVEACADAGSVALVGAPVGDDGRGRYIGTLRVDAAGASVAYRKVWLGGNEHHHFTPGREPTVLQLDGWRLGLAICRDTGVPQHAADTAALGMDSYLAGVLEFADEVHIVEERARRVAAAYNVWVAIASFAGSTGAYVPAAGRSGIWAPGGVAVARAGPEIGAIARATVMGRARRRTAEQAAAHPDHEWAG